MNYRVNFFTIHMWIYCLFPLRVFWTVVPNFLILFSFLLWIELSFWISLFNYNFDIKPSVHLICCFFWSSPTISHPFLLPFTLLSLFAKSLFLPSLFCLLPFFSALCFPFMAFVRSESSSRHRGKELVIKRTPFEKEGDEENSIVKSDHSKGEGTTCDPNSECLSLLNPWYNRHIHFLLVVDGYTYPPLDQVWLFLDRKVTNVSWVPLTSAKLMMLIVTCVSCYIIYLEILYDYLWVVSCDKYLRVHVRDWVNSKALIG